MRVGLLSDIHANLPALNAVLDDLPADLDAICCAGDIVGYSAWPAECVERVREVCDVVVRGNHDREVDDPDSYSGNEMARAGLKHAKAELSAEQRSWVTELPPVTEVETIIGFEIVFVIPPEGVADYFTVDTATFPTGEENAIIHAIGVTEDWEGRSVGGALLYHLPDMVRDLHDVDAAFGNAWLRDQKTDSAVLFEHYGLERLMTVENSFQRSDSDRTCPDCTPGTCTCSSAIYANQFA